MATQQVDLGNVKGPPGPQGPAGQSPYQAAVDGGYTGTEAQFNSQLAQIGTYVSENNPVFIGSFSSNRRNETTVGFYSVAIGSNNTSSGFASCAEGVNTVATGQGDHAEGDQSVASGGYGSHAEGYKSTASGQMSHAEGRETKAVAKNGSHAEGYGTQATGESSHAEGAWTVANGFRSHAEGSNTTSDNQDSHAGGKFNTALTTGGTETNQVGDVFVLGNGTNANSRSNAFRVTYAGTVYGKGQFQTTGADYAEFFEWLDQNPDNEDRIGHFVTLEGKKIKIAQPGDYILGIVSGNPCIVGNADEDWLGRWVHDDFDRFVKEYLEETETEVQPPNDLTEDELAEWINDNDVEEQDGSYFKKTAIVVDYETPSWRFKANPDYDSSQPYVERKDRQEWDYVGMLGVLAVLDDGTCQVNGFCQVAEDGTATKAESYVPGLTYRVIERVNDNIVKVVFR